MRLFVAVWPPDDVLDTLAALPRPALRNVRWTGREQWHVTLRFLGEVPSAGPVSAALRVVGAPPCRAVLGPAVGRFGQRVLHVPVAGLEEVAAAMVRATADVGRPPEDRPFAGHVTLARGRPGADLRPLVGRPVAGEWDVGEACLVSSVLHPHGARYQVLERFPLG